MFQTYDLFRNVYPFSFLVSKITVDWWTTVPSNFVWGLSFGLWSTNNVLDAVQSVQNALFGAPPSDMSDVNGLAVGSMDSGRWNAWKRQYSRWCVCLCFPCPVFFVYGGFWCWWFQESSNNTFAAISQSPDMNQKTLHNFAWCTVCFKGWGVIWDVPNLGALGCVDCYDVDDLEIWPGWHRLASVEITWNW